jgi:anti-sigma regulatory factor (Ser/Thr protein kinase)
MTLTGSERSGGIAGTALDRRVHLITVDGDASTIGREVRSHAADAVESGRITAIVDLSAATRIGGPLAWELSRAHERSLWRGGQVIVVLDSGDLRPLFEAFALHRTPDVVATLAEALAAARVSEAGVARARESSRDPHAGPPTTTPGSAAPRFTWRRHEELPATWSFELQGGRSAPGVARAAVGRVLRGRMGGDAERDALLLVSEAVTNSVVHGGGTGVLRVWAEDGYVVCEVHDKGRLADPLAGRRPVPRDQRGGRGLLMVNLVGDLVRVHTGEDGTAIRCYLAR